MYHQEQSNSNSGLLRFRSAPTSLFSNFTNGIGGGGDSEESKPLGNGYSLSSQLPPQYPRHRLTTTQLGTTMEMDNSNNSSSYRVMGSSNLLRQSSSPAGLFSHLNSQNGYGALRGFGNYRVGNGTNGDVGLYSNRLKGQMNFSSGMASSLGMLSQIPEIDSEDIKLGNGSRDSPFYSPGYTCGLWNDSSHFPENFPVLKRDLDDDGKLFVGTQNAEHENRPHILSHHLSLPKISAEMAAMEKLLHFQDTVPCKVRAKRGCATHPRSIAERVRRTRISERMRKLQELVPNMDKQTNTADMLDLAVDYIKELQKQHKILSENRANCKCSGIQKRLPNFSA